MEKFPKSIKEIAQVGCDADLEFSSVKLEVAEQEAVFVFSSLSRTSFFSVSFTNCAQALGCFFWT